MNKKINNQTKNKNVVTFGRKKKQTPPHKGTNKKTNNQLGC
jgi:hypothetical protein